MIVNAFVLQRNAENTGSLVNELKFHAESEHWSFAVPLGDSRNHNFKVD